MRLRGRTKSHNALQRQKARAEMWKAVLLAVCLLVSSVQALEGNPTYGVKLCGREFIRAVIFTCGGSRWRRAVRGASDLAQDPFSTHDDEASDSWSTDSIPGLSYPQLPEMEAPGWARDGREGALLSRSARSLMSEEVLEALRTSDRKGRDVVVGLSNACCKWGCSKSEISSLC
ncbi:relaxin-3-like [Anguilla anguilla]|nr:relaxin-3-like [Anguilla anguilla]XP_035254671.1 relaxin-3-like [Anguilla anguilla]